MSQIVTKKTLTEEYLNGLKELCNKATQVVGWYHHHMWSNEVRGPFGRWFTVSGGDNGMGDPVKYPTPVAELYEDAAFCAAAMSALPALLELLDEKEAKIRELKSDLVRIVESDPRSRS